MKEIIVLGGGRVGSAIAHDLSIDYTVTVADINQKTLQKLQQKYNYNTIYADLSDLNSFKQLLHRYDLVISAVPGFMGFEVLKTIIENKKNVVDISFFPENALELNELAQQNNVTALVDFGVAPGLGNILFGHYDTIMKINSYECYVGGLPKEKNQPFEYKAPFSPIDVIEEYTRPARLFENGDIVVKEPLSEIELIHFNEVEDLEAFNTDGLRSLLYTMSHVPFMKEKTLRYPGHAQKIQLLKDIGFFEENTRKINNNDYTPIEITANILKENWFLKENEEEFTVMRIIVENETRRIEIDLYDQYDKNTKITSMARTTGYTCTAGANLLLNNIFNNTGVFPPEIIGKNLNCYAFIIKYLQERKITLTTKES
jgi:lysine 6-dehydrogenase